MPGAMPTVEWVEWAEWKEWICNSRRELLLPRKVKAPLRRGFLFPGTGGSRFAAGEHKLSCGLATLIPRCGLCVRGRGEGGHGIENSALCKMFRRLRAEDAAVDLRRARTPQTYPARDAGVRVRKEP